MYMQESLPEDDDDVYHRSVHNTRQVGNRAQSGWMEGATPSVTVLSRQFSVECNEYQVLVHRVCSLVYDSL